MDYTPNGYEPNDSNSQNSQNENSQTNPNPYDTGNTGSSYNSGSTGNPYENGNTGSSYNSGSTGNPYDTGSTGSSYNNGNAGNSYNNYNYGGGSVPPSGWQTVQPGGSQKPPKRSGGLVAFATIVTIAFVCVTIALISNIVNDNSVEETESAATGETISLVLEEADGEDLTTTDGTITSYNEIAEKVLPSVVGVISYQDDTAYSSGSGVVITSDGYIVTNAHVVADLSTGATYDAVEVIMSADLAVYQATIIGVDTKTDLAVLKIDAPDLTPAELGDSDSCEVGDVVLAIGNPGGISLAGSVTQGIISATNRSIQTATTGYYMDCIQTDAAINPGNSGGALVNVYGQVIGIPSSKLVSTSYEGIGFAIAMNDVKPIVESLIQNGYVENRAKLGITYTMITEDTASQYGLEVGLMIQTISEDSDLYGKDVQQGDVITAIDGEAMTSTSQVTEFFRNKSPGDTVTLTISRVDEWSGESTTFTITATLVADTGSSSDTSSGE